LAFPLNIPRISTLWRCPRCESTLDSASL